MTDELPADLNQFLSQVDDIHRLVQNLSSNDETDVAKAMQESDHLLKQVSKTGVDRTVINKSSSTEKQHISPDSFMVAMEKDAEERAERRRMSKIQADEWKTKGNDAFHQQLYEKAIEYYTEGLKVKKDYDILYTNRAQVYVKQGRYDDAINDCEWALKVTPNFIKAYVIKGKCWMHRKDFDLADKEFREAEQIAVTNFESIATRRMIEECLADVERQREKHRREDSARVFLANENTDEPLNLSNTLKKLNTDHQATIFYTGGIDLLCQLINNETTRTAFRVQRGFDLFNQHSVLRRTVDEQLTQSIFNLMNILSENDDENLQLALESEFVKNYFQTKDLYSVKALEYLVEMSLNNKARLIILRMMNIHQFLPNLIQMISAKKSRTLNRLFAMKLLSNLAIENKVKDYFQHEEHFQKLIQILTLSTSIDEQTRHVLFSLLTNLCSEKQIRSYAVNRTDLLSIAIDHIERQTNEYQLNLLGLLVNLTNEPSENLEKSHRKLVELIVTKMNDSPHHQRLFTLLGNLVMHYQSIITYLIDNGVVSWTSRTLTQTEKPNEETTRAAIRLLALCTQSNQQAQDVVANETALLTLIYEQLFKSEHSLLIGNAALMFGHVIHHSSVRSCLQKHRGIEQMIKDLLKLVEQSWLTKAAKKNVAIFLTKLVKADANFLEEFRNQHGTEILHSALKDVDF